MFLSKKIASSFCLSRVVISNKIFTQQRRNIAIHTTGTSNTDCVKFHSTDTSFLPEGRTMDFESPSKAGSSPLARYLFAVDGIRRVFISSDYITVTKEPNLDWDDLTIKVVKALSTWKSSELPVVHSFEDEEESEDTTPKEEDSEEVLAIKEVVHAKIRPMVLADGGNVKFIGFENGIVYVQLQGACETCSSSSITLKHGIERVLRHYVPEVKEVVGVSAEQAQDMEEVWKAQGSFKGVI